MNFPRFGVGIERPPALKLSTRACQVRGGCVYSWAQGDVAKW